MVVDRVTTSSSPVTRARTFLRRERAGPGFRCRPAARHRHGRRSARCRERRTRVSRASAQHPSSSTATTRRARLAPRASSKRTVSRRTRPRIQAPGTGSAASGGVGAGRGDVSENSQTRAGWTTTLPNASRRGRIFTTAGPGSRGPVRTFGPARSMMMRHGRPCRSSARRRCSMVQDQFVGPVMSAVHAHAVHPLLQQLRDERVVVSGLARHGDHDGHAAAGWPRAQHGLGVGIEQALTGRQIGPRRHVSRCVRVRTRQSAEHREHGFDGCRRAWDSARPRDERPAAARLACKGRWSRLRSAR